MTPPPDAAWNAAVGAGLTLLRPTLALIVDDPAAVAIVAAALQRIVALFAAVPPDDRPPDGALLVRAETARELHHALSVGLAGAEQACVRRAETLRAARARLEASV